MRLKLEVQCKVLKDNLLTFSDIYMIAKRIGIINDSLVEIHPYAYTHQKIQ